MSEKDSSADESASEWHVSVISTKNEGKSTLSFSIDFSLRSKWQIKYILRFHANPASIDRVSSTEFETRFAWTGHCTQNNGQHLPPTDYRLLTTDRRQPTDDCWLLTTDCRLLSADYRLPTVVCHQTSTNFQKKSKKIWQIKILGYNMIAILIFYIIKTLYGEKKL